jgi:lactate dehydrogenase-like 2-hydroxyacid dehydrogenase
LINKETIERMKRSAIIVNTARGPIINEKDLVEALKNGRISCAGLDVFENEPLVKPNDFNELKNVVLSPHNAGITPEVTKAGLELTVNNVEQFFNGTKQNLVC